jgi:hypothetical protein
MKPDLNQRLREAQVPVRSPGYWETFPQRVRQAVLCGSALPSATGFPWRWAWAGAVALLVVAGVMLLRPQPVAGPDYAKLYREVAAMFPDQVEAIIADEQGVRLVLADQPSERTSPPLLVRACNPTGCRSVITFSGQQVPINGDRWDVLLDGTGHVFVAGRTAGNYRIEGGVL